MSRKFLSWGIVLGLVLGAAPVVGQDLILGAKGGVNIADISTDDPEFAETDARTAFQVGAFLSIGLGDVFAVQPEAYYAQKGTGFTEGGVDIDLKIDYFEIPLLFKAVLGPEDGRVRFGPFVGGAVAFEASCTIEGSEGEVEVSVDCDDPGEGIERETTDFGLLFGAEVMFDMSDDVVLLLDGRYNLGLRNLEAGESDLSTKSRTFSVMAGVGLRLN